MTSNGLSDVTTAVHWVNLRSGRESKVHFVPQDVSLEDVRAGQYTLSCGRRAPRGGDGMRIEIAMGGGELCEFCALGELDPSAGRKNSLGLTAPDEDSDLGDFEEMMVDYLDSSEEHAEDEHDS